ncbi:tRNA (5-methylaminomethyl-2-thiouridine)(34)-methyltransferase MnmD [Mesonia aquimarina]|uniref:tRNA (5-methylaminomethyl-2-thiouridine)(34)-methyltransferase MnmD n=1 Tax=Mesonia aquimarina TaxID=1504967 RepID=UPI000EF5E26D|nr:tRNA (5-methylaminomethyl-2-thiouridine)(34)-methyltransferase MnmD [Mesonia aquimarina]
MKREIITTADGSSTIHIPEWDEQYHSKHGAIQEAQHVFIKTGLHYFIEQYKTRSVSILEIGFGTGLNALITALEAEKKSLAIQYTGIEAYPVSLEELQKLNYTSQFSEASSQGLFQKIHTVSWENIIEISSNFTLKKECAFFEDIQKKNSFNLIYFDAFGARVQPDLWTVEIFRKMYEALKPNGILVTYSAKGSVKRAMKTVGFLVEKLPGPPGKREMLRAQK